MYSCCCDLQSSLPLSPPYWFPEFPPLSWIVCELSGVNKHLPCSSNLSFGIWTGYRNKVVCGLPCLGPQAESSGVPLTLSLGLRARVGVGGGLTSSKWVSRMASPCDRPAEAAFSHQICWLSHGGSPQRRKPCGSCVLVHKLASEVTWHDFCCVLWVEAITSLPGFQWRVKASISWWRWVRF